MTRSEELEAWAKKQKRITNYLIRKRFNVDEERDSQMFEYLKKVGIVLRMGYTRRGLYGEED